jgi:ferrous iron transport protein B
VTPDGDAAPVPSIFSDGRPDRVVALAGNPNVGKSTIFNHLTGLGVTTAHYPGKTLEVNIGVTSVGDAELTVIDLPGAYGLAETPDAEWVNRRALLDVQPEAVIVVLDATNLTRNLVFLLELLDLGLPVVAALNLDDEARRQGIVVYPNELSESLGVPVFPTVAVDGRGIAELMEYVALLAAGDVAIEPVEPDYGDAVNSAIAPLAATVRFSDVAPFGLSSRAAAIQLLEGHRDVITALGDKESLMRVGREARTAIETRTDEDALTAIRRGRHGLAGVIADEVTTRTGRKRSLDLLALATRPLTGIPILMAVLGAIFLLLFFIGEFLAGIVSTVWQNVFSPIINTAVTSVFGEGTIASETLLWGLDAGLEAALSIGIPYILTFYFLLAILEDSGYLNAVAFLTDRAMHRMGLHGRSIIPLVAGLGCSVPAVLGTRTLSTPRERYIASTLICMIPCSARTAVILGAAGHFIGIGPALGVFLVSFVVTVIVGLTLNRMMPGSSTGLVMEIFAFRRPSVRIVLGKSWAHFREFLFVATPLVVLGSMFLGFLYETELIFDVVKPLEPIVTGWLGLPAVTGITLLFGLLRKEFALQLLVAIGIATMGNEAADLTTFMSDVDLFVYALVNTLAMPCIATVAVLGRILGWGRAASVMAITVGVALLVGGLFARLLPAVGLLVS